MLIDWYRWTASSKGRTRTPFTTKHHVRSVSSDQILSINTTGGTHVTFDLRLRVPGSQRNLFGSKFHISLTP